MCIECFEKLPMFYYKGDRYYEWQDDEYSRIGFSAIPDIENKVINKNVMTPEEIKAAKAKPLVLNNTIDVILIDKQKNKNYTFTVLAGYDYDGASIPRILWRLIGSKESIEFKVAALIHDVLCENKQNVDCDRYFADKVFERLLEVGDVCAFKRWLMFHSVDNYQKFCGWEKAKKEMIAQRQLKRFVENECGL